MEMICAFTGNSLPAGILTSASLSPSLFSPPSLSSMYAHIFPASQGAHDPIVNKSLRLDNWPGKLTTLWHAFVHGRLSKPPPPLHYHRFLSELSEDWQGKTEASEEKTDRLSLSSLSSSSTLLVVGSGEFHTCSSTVLPKGEVPVKASPGSILFLILHCLSLRLTRH